MPKIPRDPKKTQKIKEKEKTGAGKVEMENTSMPTHESSLEREKRGQSRGKRKKPIQPTFLGFICFRFGPKKYKKRKTSTQRGKPAKKGK